MGDVVELDSISGVELELALVDTRDGNVMRPVDGTTEELPELVGRVDGAKLLGERKADVDSDRVRSVDDDTAELPILLVRLMEVLDDISAERVGSEVGLGRDTVKPSLCVDRKPKEPTVVVDVPGLRVAEPADRLVNVVDALKVVDTFEPVESTQDVPPGVLGSMLELRPGRVRDETTGEGAVLKSVEIVDGDRIMDSVEKVVDNPLLIVTTLVDAGYDG